MSFKLIKTSKIKFMCKFDIGLLLTLDIIWFGIYTKTPQSLVTHNLIQIQPQPFPPLTLESILSINMRCSITAISHSSTIQLTTYYINLIQKPNQLLCIRDWLLSGPEVMTIHICTYNIRLFSLQGLKLPGKSFRVPFLRQGSFFKINERNISEATKFFEGSKLAKKLKDKKLFFA